MAKKRKRRKYTKYSKEEKARLKRIILENLMEGKSGLPSDTNPSEIVEKARARLEKMIEEGWEKGRPLSQDIEEIMKEAIDEFEAQVQYDPTYAISLKRHKVSERGKKKNG